MEARITNSAFETLRIVDVFSSFLWNVPYIGYGDFECRWPMSIGALNFIQDGNYVSIKESDRYMIIEHVEIKTDVQNGNYAIISGRSLESLLTRRIIRKPTVLTGNIQDCILRLLNSEICSPSDTNRINNKICFIKSNDQKIADINIDAEFNAGDNLYSAITAMCNIAKVGFRMTPQDDRSIAFELFNGIDRSYSQEEVPWVVFSSNYENLKETDMIVDTTGYKNVAIVESEWTTRNDNGDEEKHSITVEVGSAENGMDRREIYVLSRVRPDDVDISQFGSPDDRVNKRDFMTYEPVYFNSAAYKEAMDAYNAKVSSMLSPRKKETQEWKLVKRDPESATPENPILPDKPDTQWTWSLQTVPGESVEDWEKRNQRALAWADNNMPSKEEFMKYDWVLTDVSGYQIALENAQSQIDLEYNAAVASSLNIAKEQMKNEGLSALAPYLVISEFQGEVDNNLQFIYGRDYGLGDIVQIVNEYGFQATTRVVSMLYSEEEGEGFRAIPSFASDNPAKFEI